ncbi:MAG: M12 family metallo-peptidase [Phycisphaerales bacterium]
MGRMNKLCFVWGLCGAAASMAFAADAKRSVLLDAGDIAGLRAETGPEVMRSRLARVDVSALPASADAPGSTVSLALFDNLDVNVIIDKVDPGLVGTSGRVLVGHIEGQADRSRVYLSQLDDILVVDVLAPQFGNFQVRYLDEGVHAVLEVDESKLLPCGVGPMEELVGLAEGGNGVPVPADPAIEAGGDMGGPDTNGAGSGPQIDIVVFYTPTVGNNAGGLNGMQAAMASWQSQTNNAYATSQVKGTIRIVNVQQTNYTESGNGSTDLSRLASNGDGNMDEVHSIRNQYGADLVHLIVWNTDVCGIAFLMTNVSTGFAGSGFGLTAFNCGGIVLAHELGHNMGLAHDRDNAGSSSRCFGYGYRTPNAQLRTIMAYAPGTRVPVFSNPSVSWGGFPMGVAEIPNCQNFSEACENARALNLNHPTTAAFRPTVVGNPPPEAFSLMSPSNGALGQNNVVSLSWAPSTNAASYDVVVSRNQDLSNPVFSDNVFTTNATTSLGALVGNTQYWWNVTARNFAGTITATGGPWSFRTAPQGDVNGDGVVNFADLNIVLGQFGQTGFGLPGDINGDEVVNFTDLNIVLSNFGT